MNITREFTGPVNTLLQFYQATWNPKYGKMAKRSIKWLCLTMDEPGKWPFKVATGGSDGDEATIIEGWLLRHPGGMVPQLLYDAVQVFGDETPIFKACLLGLAQKYIWWEGPIQDMAFKLGDAGVKRQDCMNNHSLIAYAYELSGNPVYAAWCEYYMREIFPKSAQRETEQPHLRHVTVFKKKGEKTVFENLGDGESHGSIFNSTWWAFLVPPMAWAVIEAEKKLGVDGLRCVQEDWIDKVTTNLSGKNTQVKTTAEMLAGKTTSSLGVIQGYK